MIFDLEYYFFGVFFRVSRQMAATFTVCSGFYSVSRAMAEMQNGMSLWNTELTMIKIYTITVV